jgi:hypothetical protein
MGEYVYKVTAKTVKLTDGTKANVAVFAYKPYGWDSDGLNGKMYFQTGCPAAERFVKGKNYTGKVVLGGLKDGKLYVGSTVAKKCTRGTLTGYEFEFIMADAGVPVNMPVGTNVAFV